MDLKKIIREELTGLEWIQDINPIIPAKDLQPGNIFMIVKLSGKSLEDYMRDDELSGVDPFTTVFEMSEDGFSDEYGEESSYYKEGVIDIWLDAKNLDRVSGWVDLKGMWVTLTF